MRRPGCGWLFLAGAVGYVLLHVLAAALGMPPDRFFLVIAKALGFALGSLIIIACVAQLVRR